MSKNPPPSLKEDVARATNLFAHPLAGVAAASALGMGFFTQAIGLWAGTFAAMMDAGRSNEAPATEDMPEDRQETLAALKARARAVNLIQDAQSLADEVASGDAEAVAVKTAKPAPKRKATSAKRGDSVGAAQGEPAMKRPAVVNRPASPDDLKAISGIGPKLEQLLNGLGIWTYAQIASWSKAEITWAEDQLGFGGRIERDDWLGQAAKLASER